MLHVWRVLCGATCLAAFALGAQEAHDHAAPEKLGAVSFPITCKSGTQQQFDRAVALLHSFAYTAAEEAFEAVAKQDPRCAMAYWGMAMTHFHPLWEPTLPAATVSIGQGEVERAARIGSGSERERGYIQALRFIYENAATVPYRTRAMNYERAMRGLAAANPKDVEAQVFYALALLANASPADKTHSRQKQAADVIEPLYRMYPQHPGMPHYLIHAYDNSEMAARGLPAAREYARIAPSAPHALHMPSHIYTRLGLWDDSISSNIAARSAARQQGDTREELHAMDYLVYAYLQKGSDRDAAQVIDGLKEMPQLNSGDFTSGYAATAMPVRYAVERRQWSDAAGMANAGAGTPPQVAAIAVWARGLGLARSGRPEEAHKEAEELRRIAEQLGAVGNDYWAIQVKIMMREVMAWIAQAEKHPDEAVALMRKAADEEDAIEKLPVTPGPIVPAREQLGDLLLAQGNAELASAAFKTALANAPGRRGALQGAAQAALMSGQR